MSIAAPIITPIVTFALVLVTLCLVCPGRNLPQDEYDFETKAILIVSLGWAALATFLVVLAR